MASNEIDRPLSHGCLTQLLKDQALVNSSFVKAQDPLSLHIFSKLNYCKTELFCLVSLLICSIINIISFRAKVKLCITNNIFDGLLFQNSIQYMKHAKRKRLTTEDFNKALKRSSVQVCKHSEHF